MITVPMHNPETGKTADVHPDEVANWKAWGFRESEPKTLPPPPAQMRAAIKAATGAAPGPNTSKEKLAAQYRSIDNP